MPHVQAMQRDGLTFNNYFVSDSLCCPSRSSIFTGNFPHDTQGVQQRGPRRAASAQFYDRGEELHTFAVALQRAGYRTAMMGKYLNGYGQHKGSVPGLPYTYVPPGWSEWDVAGWGYPEFNYSLNEDGQLQQYGQPAHGLPDRRAGRQGRRLHQQLGGDRAAVLPRARDVRPARALHAGAARRQRLPRAAGTAAAQLRRAADRSAPRWLAGRPPLDADQIEQINSVFRRARPGRCRPSTR